MFPIESRGPRDFHKSSRGLRESFWEFDICSCMLMRGKFLIFPLSEEGNELKNYLIECVRHKASTQSYAVSF